MKVKDLIEALSQFDEELPVVISDGHKYITYEDLPEISLYDGDGIKIVDMGVGGTQKELSESQYKKEES